MCGRFTLTVPDFEELAEALGAVPLGGELYRPRFNIAPTDKTWIVARDDAGKRTLSTSSWGLVPWWSKTPKDAGRPINARAEGIDKRPAFRDAFANKRCIVVADGFYEWKRDGSSKTPFWLIPQVGGLLLMGGVYDTWKNPETGERTSSFSIVTTGPNHDMDGIHDRMPLVVPPPDIDAWLGGNDAASIAVAKAMLHPAPDGSLVRKLVSRRVGSVKNDDPSLLEPDNDNDLPEEKPKKKRAPKKTGQIGMFDTVDKEPASGRKS